MFDESNIYANEIERLIEEIESKELGLQVIKVKKWALPIKKYNVELEISKSKSLNIIEEFIIKIALSNLGCEINEDVIKSMLGLDEIFISKYVNRLSALGVIDRKKLPNICITDIGKEQFEKGQVLTKDRRERIDVFIQPKFKLFYSDLNTENFSYPFIDLEEDEIISVKMIENNSDLMNRIIDIAKENKIIVNRDTVNQFISKVNSIRLVEDNLGIDFVELWIYDIVEEKLYCRVWDCQQNQYNDQISEFIMKFKPISKDDFEIDSYDYNEESELEDKYEQKFKEEIKAKRNNDLSNKLTLRMVRGREIKKEFNNCLKSVKKYLYIQSPWISENVVDEKMISMFKDLVNKNCKIFISWGISRDIEKEDRKPDQHLIDILRNIKDSYGMPGIFIYWVGNHHNKEIIVDDELHLAGSFNWLSYRGDYLPRGESVYITNDSESIKEAKIYWEDQIFNKISQDIYKENYIRDISALINLETKKNEVSNLVKDIFMQLIYNKNEDSYTKIYNITLVYFKNKLFNQVFIDMISSLIEKEKFLKEAYIMINYLKKNNNSEIYKDIVEKYKDNFIKYKIVDEKLKSSKLLNKKNIANKLGFIQ